MGYVRIVWLHAFIAMLFLMGPDSRLLPVSEELWLGLFIGAHLLLPINAFWRASLDRMWRCFVLGPGALLALYLGWLVQFVLENRNGRWTALIVVFVLGVLAIFTLYSMVVMAIMRRWKMRRRP